jgi:hypothetical protein
MRGKRRKEKEKREGYRVDKTDDEKRRGNTRREE